MHKIATIAIKFEYKFQIVLKFECGVAFQNTTLICGKISILTKVARLTVKLVILIYCL